MNIENTIDNETRERLRALADEQRAAANGKRRSGVSLVASMIERARAKGYRAPDYRLRWKLDNAAELLAQGLVMVLGDKAQWLPEYDEIAGWLADNDGKGLMCIGSCGRGKTVITRDVLPWIFAHHLWCDLDGQGGYGRPVYSYFKADRDLKDSFNTMLHSRVLCIDDLGTEQTKFYGQTKNYFDELVQNDNFERRQLLVCSTNLTYYQLFGGEDPDTHVNHPCRYDERTKSRLLGCCKRAFFEGDDLRI